MMMMEQGLEQIQMLLMDEENRMIDRAEAARRAFAITRRPEISVITVVSAP